MDGPRPELLRWIERTRAGARLEPLSGDASSRRFWRLYLASGDSAVVMDYGAPFVGEPDDVILVRLFQRAGLPVARILDSAAEAGCLLLEDLGDRMLSAALDVAVTRAGTAEAQKHVPPLLEQAAGLAGRVATAGTPALASSERASGPALDESRFRFEMDFFLEHYVGGLAGKTVIPEELHDAVSALAVASAGIRPQVLCHRDFHSRNLMVVAGDTLAMVDIQDARWGPDGYDLVSLLWDAYATLDDAWRQPLVEAWLEARPGRLRGGIDEPLRLLAAQRMVKALGTFGYQIHRLGRERYRPAVPRTLRRLDQLLPELPATRRLHQLLSAEGLLADPR